LQNIHDLKREFYGVVELTDNLYYDNDGALICKNAVLGKAGKQMYHASELGLDSDETIVIERPEEEVFDERSLGTLQGKTLTLGHPEDDVNIENYNEHSRGFVLDVWREGNLIRGNIKVTDKEAINLIVEKEMRELSLGYSTRFDTSDGNNIRMTEISYNHVALVPRGRAEVAKIIDMNQEMRVMDKQFENNERSYEDMPENKNSQGNSIEELQNLRGEVQDLLTEVKQNTVDNGDEGSNKEENHEIVTDENQKPKQDEETPEEYQGEEKDEHTKMLDEFRSIDQIQDAQLKDALKRQAAEKYGLELKDGNEALQAFANQPQNLEKEKPEKFSFNDEYKNLLERINPNNYDNVQDYIKERKKVARENTEEVYQELLEEALEGGNQ